MTPTYCIKNKTQLTFNEYNSIIESIKNLNSSINNNIEVNYNGTKKMADINEINKIFQKYSINL